jgi:hypothetical protein
MMSVFFVKIVFLTKIPNFMRLHLAYEYCFIIQLLLSLLQFLMKEKPIILAQKRFLRNNITINCWLLKFDFHIPYKLYKKRSIEILRFFFFRTRHLYLIVSFNKLSLKYFKCLHYRLIILFQ